MRSEIALSALALALAACSTTSATLEPLAAVHVANDYRSYTLHRVGLLPPSGADIGEADALALQGAFLSELGLSLSFEVVPLSASDLDEIPRTDPFRRGRIEPRTIVDLAHRYQLDGVLVSTVTERHFYAPQRLGVQMDLVASETGMPIWSAAVHLDASEEHVRQGLRDWFEVRKGGGESGETWELWLLSPKRFAQFAAFQLAREL
jgi:hypothetical protein